MLYLNSVENAAASKTDKKYAICYEKIPAMQNITELGPSKELLTQWESKEIGWEEFRKNFMAEMRAEYRKEESRLKKLIQYSLENDITLHSPEPNGEQTYRAILEEIINNIWQGEGRTDRVINLVGDPVEPFHLTVANQEQMKQIATKCKFFYQCSKAVSPAHVSTVTIWINRFTCVQQPTGSSFIMSGQPRSGSAFNPDTPEPL